MTTRLSRPPRGFTLVELLAVMSIMIIVMVLTVSAFSNFARGMDVTNSAQHVGDILNLARQVATSRGEYAQVRFLTLNDSADSRSGHYSAIAVYRSDSPLYTNDYSTLLANGRMRSEGQVVNLPQSVAILSNSTYSPLLANLSTNSYRTGTGQYGGKTYNWVGFYYKPDGSTDIPPSSSNSPASNSFSLCPIQAFKSKNALPPNYVVLALDRIDGRLSVVRP